MDELIQQKANEHTLHHTAEIDKFETYFSRPELSEDDLTKRFSYRPIKLPNMWRDLKKHFQKHYKPSANCLGSFLLDTVPMCRWILEYNVRENLFKDFVAGITIGIVQIPQGLAFGLLAGLPPIVGLYVSFFPVLIYSLLGTSRHLSLGVYAIVAIMVKAITEGNAGVLYPTPAELASAALNGTMSSSAPLIDPGYLSNDPVQAKMQIGAALSLLTGIIQVGFAILHVGFVTKFLSDIIVSGFTTGAAYHIITSQVSTLLGIKLNTVDLPTVLIGDYIEIFRHISTTNFATLIISIISMIVLYCVKHFINERYKKKLPVPVPIDLIVMIIGTVLSYFLNFKSRWNVSIVGDIPLGMPPPSLPPMSLLSVVISPSINIAIVSFAVNLSMAKLYSKKYKYSLDANQELVAYGAGNIIAGLFSGFPSCVGLSRCAILDSIGVKTQLYGIISAALVLIVIMVLGPLFKTLPTCVLGAIIAVALIGLLMEVKQIYYIYKKSKFEALAWLVTFLGVIILNVDIGLYIGMVFSLLLIIVHTQRALTAVLGNIPYTDIYESIEICEEAKEFEGIKIIRYESSLYYANVDHFVEEINKLSGVDPTHVHKKLHKIRVEHERAVEARKRSSSNGQSSFLRRAMFWKKNKSSTYSTRPETPTSGVVESGVVRFEEDDEKFLKRKLDEVVEQFVNIQHIVIDLSSANFIDSMGVEAIVELKEQYKELGITLHLTYCKRCLFHSFEKYGMREVFSYENIYPMTHDAILTIIKRRHSHNIHLVSKRKRSSIDIHVMQSIEMDDDSQNTRPDENMDNQENPAGNPNDTIANTPITVSKM